MSLKQSSTSYLCYGDLIIMCGQQINVFGVLTATGYCENRILLQKYPIDLDNPTSPESIETVINMSNYRDMVLQVWPRLSYDATKEYQKLQRYYNRIKRMIQTKDQADKQKKYQYPAVAAQSNSSNSDGNYNENKVYDENDQLLVSERMIVQQQENQQKDRQILLQDLEINLNKLKYKMNIESEVNQRQLSTVIGEPVLYGQDIQLMHQDSKYFIKAQLLTSDVDKAGYKFVLNNSYGSGMLFKFQPRYKLRQIGEKIEFKDQIIIYNLKLGGYVNFALSPVIELDILLQYPPKIEPSHNSPQSHQISQKYNRLQSYMSNEAVTNWLILPFSKPQTESSDSNNFQGGELIRFKHTETQGTLSADINYLDGEPEAYIYIYNGNYPEEEDQVSSIWQVEIDSAINRGADLLIQKESDKQQPNRYRLRHLLTGRLLTLGNKLINDRQYIIPLLAKPNQIMNPGDNSSQIYFIPTNSVYENCIQNQGTYSLGIGDLKLNVSDENYIRQTKTRDDSVYTPLENKETFTKRKAVIAQQISSAQNAFICQKIDNEEKENILFIRSSIEQLKYFIRILQTGQKQLITSDLIKKIIRILSSLIFFILPDADEFSDDPVEVEAIADRTRQVLLKQMYLLEMLTDILYYPFYTDIYSMQQLSNSDGDIIKIFQLTNRLIKHIIKEYRPNELYASQWLDMLMKQITIKQCDIKAAATLTELIDNNNDILTHKIKKETIKYFIDLLMEDQEQKYINLLRALCSIDGEPAQKNQLTISEEIFENEIVRSRLIYQFRIVNTDLQIYVFGEWIFLALFKQKSQIIDDLKSFKYFISLIELIADLCLQRNYIAINKVKDILTYDKCYELISDSQYGYELRSAFVRLTMNLWIDREPFEQLIFPNRIRIWNDIKTRNSEDVYSTKHKEDIQKFNNLKQYTSQYILSLFKKQFYSNAMQNDKNTFTLNILKMITLMIKFGFYTSIKELTQILIPVADLLNGIRDVTTIEEEEMVKSLFGSESLDQFTKKKKKKQNYNELVNNQKYERLKSRYEITEENLVLMKIKEMAAIIILLIYEFRIDYKVTQFLHKFKVYYDGFEENNNKAQAKRNSLSHKLFSKMQDISRLNFLENQETLLDFRQEVLTPLHISKINEWIEETIQDHSLEVQSSLKNNFNTIIIDLMLYKYFPLINNTFELLYKRFCQRETLTEYLLEIQIIEDSDTLKNYMQIQELSREIRKSAEQAEIWYGQETDSVPNSQSESILKSLSSLCQIIATQKTQKSFLKLLKGQQTLALQQTKEGNIEESDTLFKSGEQINKQFQQLMCNLEVYQGILTLLDFDLKFKEQNNDVSINILNKCYEFLAKFVYNNIDNQQLMIQSLDMFLSHLQKTEKIQVNFLLQELVKNNNYLLQVPDNKPTLIKIIHTILDSINNLPETQKRRINLLETLRVFMKYKQTAIYDNQILLLNKLTSKKLKNVIRYANTIEEREYILDLLKKYGQQFKKITLKTVELQPELDYFCLQLYIIAVTCEDLNSATETKCQTYFTLESLYYIFDNAKNCWSIKKAVLFFLYHVYLDTEREFNEDQRYLINLLNAILSDIDNICSDTIKFDMPFKNFKRITSIRTVIQDYFIYGILPCIDSLLERNEIQDFEVLNRDRIISTVIDGIVKFCSKEKQPDNILKEINQTLTIIRFKFPEAFAEKINKLPDYLKPKQIRHLSDIKKSVFSITKIKDKKEIPEMTKSEKIRQCIDLLIKKDEFQTEVQIEFESFIKKFVDIERISKKEFLGLCTLEFREVCDALVDLVDIREISLSPQLTLIGIQIFRKIIERENRDKKTSAIYWKPEDWIRYQDSITQIQNQLCGVGVVDVCCNIIGCQDSTKVNEEIQLKTVSLAVAMLLGGNEQVQSKFYQFMTKSDQKNTFLSGVKTLLDGYFQKISQLMTQKNNKIFDKMIEDATGQLTGTNKKARVTQENVIENNDDADDEQEDNQEFIQAMQYFQRIYQMLQLLCENHNSNLQNHLRVQTYKGQPSSKSINFVNYTAKLFNNFVKFVNNDCLDIGDSMLNFLIEVVQGPCIQNQIECTKTKLIGSCNDLVIHFDRDIEYKRRGFETDSGVKKIDKLIRKSCKLLLSLLEGNTDTFIVQNIIEGIDFDYFKKRLQFEYKDLVELKLKLNINDDLNVICQSLPDLYDEDTMEAFNIYILLANLGYLQSEAQSKLDDNDHLDQDTKNCLEFFRSQTAGIEINFHGKLNKVYFAIQPTCRNLSKATRTRIMGNVNRETPSDKIEDLIEVSIEIFDEIEHNAYLNKLPFSFHPSRFTLLKDINTILALAINLVIIVTYDWKIKKHTNELNDAEVINDDDLGVNSSYLIIILGLAQLVFSSLMVLFWLFLKAPLVIKKNWRTYIENNQQYADDINLNKLQIYDSIDEMPPDYALSLLKLKGPEDRWFYKNGQRHFGHFYLKLFYTWQSIFFLLGDNEFVYTLIYLLSSLIGVLIQEVFYSLQMIDILNRFETLRNVIKSITFNAQQLVLTAFLSILIIYIYSIISFTYLSHSFFNADTTANGEYICTTMFQCFFTTLNTGLRFGGGIGEFLASESYKQDNQSTYWFRLILDISFFVIVKITLLNIIFGIIIDTFAELRDEKKAIDEDMKSKCYICSLDSQTFDKDAGGFERHIEYDHNLWNYTYFIYLVKSKMDVNRSGIESYVADKLEAEDNSWCPILRAICINEDAKQELKEVIKKRLAELKDMIKLYLDILNQTNDKQI